MRYHGLVSITVLGLSWSATAQDAPAPLPLRSLNATPAQLPESRVETPAATSLEDELQQLRTELQAFGSTREELSINAKAIGEESDRVSFKGRQELLDLLTQLATRKLQQRLALPAEQESKSRPTPEQPTQSPQSNADQPSLEITDEVADAYALGKVLFRNSKYADAERAFRKVQPTDENRLMVKYLIATCQRKQSHWKPAINGYRAIAESEKDPVLRDLARWQLDNIRWHQQTESQLEQMRQLREKPADSSKPAVNDGSAKQ